MVDGAATRQKCRWSYRQWLIRRWLVGIGLILATLLTVPPAASQVRSIDGPFVSLTGSHEIRVGDAGPWRPVTIPGLWQEQGLSPWVEDAWYRLTFPTPAELPDDDISFVGYFLGQDEIWLNGHRIGGHGTFTLPGQGMRPFSSYGKLRIYPIPGDVLHKTHPNTLLIRLNRQMLLQNGGIPDFVFGLAGQRAAELARTRATRTIWAVDGAFLAFNCLLLFIATTARVMGVTHAVVRSAVKVTLAMTIVSYAGAHLPVADGAVDTWMTAVSFLAGLAVLAFYLEYVAASLDIDIGRIGRVLQCLLMMGVIPSGILPFAVPDAIRIAANLLTLVGLTGSLIWLTGIGLVAVRHGDRLGWLFFAVFLILIDIPIVWGMLAPETAVTISTVTGRPPVNIGGQILTVILSGIFAHRTFRFERESLRANERALRAQEQERRRVARDMHDSVGQWLGSIKLRLQALPAEDTLKPERAEEFTELLGDMDVLIDDTRRITHDLSALSVTRNGLKTAIEAHMAMIVDDNGITAEIDIPDTLNLAERTADHLYRIVQEATANAVKHGAPETISISVSLVDGRLVLSIRDDGAGFDPDAENAGLGLVSIRDRVAMLRGLARITSDHAGGTEIRISIPAPNP